MKWLALLWLLFLVRPLGFFGAQAVRLLRESWDGVIRARKDGEIRPYGATNLADELFAMFDDSIPQTNNAPVTINTPPNSSGLTVNANPGDNGFTVNGGNSTITGSNINLGGPTFSPGSNSFSSGPSTITIGRGPTNDYAGDTTNVGGSTMTFGPIKVTVCPVGENCSFHLDFPEGGLLNGQPIGGGGSGTSAFLGRVTSGTGDTYQVDLYGDGPDDSPTASVTAKVPQIDDTEEIPPGTWLDCVHQFGKLDQQGQPIFTYAFQPPIWLA